MEEEEEDEENENKPKTSSKIGKAKIKKSKPSLTKYHRNSLLLSEDLKDKQKPSGSDITYDKMD